MTTSTKGWTRSTPNPSQTQATLTHQVIPERNASEADTDPKSRRIAWADGYVRKGRAIGECPEYGGEAWCELPLSDPRRVASCVIAAENWAIEADPDYIRQRVGDEMVARRQAEEMLDAEEWDQATARIRKINSAPSWAKIQKRWSGDGA